MNEDQGERLIRSFENLASALEGIRDEFRKAGTRYWPDPKPQREAVASRIPTDEDRARESLGIDGKPLSEWLQWTGPEEDNGIIGERSAQWLKDHPPEKAKEPDAGPKVAPGRKPRKSGAGAVKSKA